MSTPTQRNIVVKGGKKISPLGVVLNRKMKEYVQKYED